jgi:hypothetical protein
MGAMVRVVCVMKVLATPLTYKGQFVVSNQKTEFQIRKKNNELGFR